MTQQILLLGIYPREIKMYAYDKWMFIQVLFIIIPNWTQPRYLLASKWINKEQDNYTIEYYPAIKRNNLLIHTITCMNLKCIVLCERGHFTYFMGNRWGNSGNSGWLYFWGCKITADGDCSHEIKRCLLLGRKVMTNLDSTLKSRDITLPTKVRLVKAMVFPVVMYGCDSWTVKKAEHQRIDAFELRCWRKLLRVPWTARRSNQFLKEISPGCSLEGLMLKLKLQYFGHLMWRVDSLEKTDAGRDLGQEEKGTTEDEMAGWHHWPDGHEFE